MSTTDDIRNQLHDVLKRIVIMPRNSERQKLLEDVFHTISGLIEMRVSVGEKK